MTRLQMRQPDLRHALRKTVLKPVTIVFRDGVKSAPLAFVCLMTLLMWSCAASPGAYKHYSIKGQVLDAQGRAVEGAEVTSIDPDTNFKANPVRTDAKGEYTFADLTSSKCRLQARKGNLSSGAADVPVGSGKLTHVDLVMK